MVGLVAKAQGLALVTRLPTWSLNAGLTQGAGWAIEAVTGRRLVGIMRIPSEARFKFADTLGELGDRELQLLDQSNRGCGASSVNSFDLLAGQRTHSLHTSLLCLI